MKLLIKDPEIVSKTWTLEVADDATIAEIIGRFLIRRGSNLNQCCLLKLSNENKLLNEPGNLDKTLPELGLGTKGLMLHSVWSVSAGHDSVRCLECIQISEKVEGRGQLKESSYSVNKVAKLASRKNADETPKKSCKSKKSDGTHKQHNVQDTAVFKQKSTPLNITPLYTGVGMGPHSTIGVRSLQNPSSSDTMMSVDRHLGDCSLSSSGAREIINTLEKIIVTCVQASDLVDQLERLSTLRNCKELTESEYIKAKGKLLD